MQRNDVMNELERVRGDFRTLLVGASNVELRAHSEGTRWTNRQPLFHMLFGCLIVATLRPLVRVSRIPVCQGELRPLARSNPR